VSLVNNLGKYALQKGIRIPEFSAELAELVGISLGDGAITERQVKVTLDTETDSEYFPYVIGLFGDLFGVIPSVCKRRNSRAADIVVSRTAAVSFLESCGLLQGNKVEHQVDIPYWIKKNPTLAQSCMRGLMDTDGSIFLETHVINGKTYSYPRVWFTSKSTPLLSSTHQILAEAGFSPKVRRDRAVTLERREDVFKYFEGNIGTHNPKHQKRYIEYTRMGA
jgi:intein/homing endonuclease